MLKVTEFIKTFLQARNAAQARAILGASVDEWVHGAPYMISAVTVTPAGGISCYSNNVYFLLTGLPNGKTIDRIRVTHYGSAGKNYIYLRRCSMTQAVSGSKTVYTIAGSYYRRYYTDIEINHTIDSENYWYYIDVSRHSGSYNKVWAAAVHVH
jgi:hypothetical protein